MSDMKSAAFAEAGALTPRGVSPAGSSPLTPKGAAWGDDLSLGDKTGTLTDASGRRYPGNFRQVRSEHDASVAGGDYVLTVSDPYEGDRYYQVSSTWYDGLVAAARPEARAWLIQEAKAQQVLLSLAAAAIVDYGRRFPRTEPERAEITRKYKGLLAQAQAARPGKDTSPAIEQHIRRAAKLTAWSLEKAELMKREEVVGGRLIRDGGTGAKRVSTVAMTDIRSAARAQVAMEPEEGPYSNGRFFAWVKARLGPGYGPRERGGTYHETIATNALHAARVERYGFDPTRPAKASSSAIASLPVPKPITDAQIEEEVVRLIVRLGSGGSEGLEAFRKELEARYPPLTVEEILRRATGVRARRR